MTKRRDFLKTAAIGTVALSSTGAANAIAPFSKVFHDTQNDTLNIKPVFNKWTVDFNEATSELILNNGAVKIVGILQFISDGATWQIVRSRDAVDSRYALVDTNGNVQGYWVVNQSDKRLELLFYHRSAQNYTGELSFTGQIDFLSDAFACRTNPTKNERVLNLTTGIADSLKNDSLFAPESDAMLQLRAATLQIRTIGNGKFSFVMSGHIDDATESTYVFNAENGYFKNRYIPYYIPITKKPNHKPPTGWMSWNTYFDTATAEDNLAEARIGKKYLQPFGCEIWHIESWQGNSDKLPVSGFYNMNLEVNEKQFPKGMKKLADDIRKLGFKPGLWTAPFGTGSDDFYNKHRDWFLHDKNGKPISSWNGKYTLDPTVKAAREHIKETHRIASREWGYEYFKIDGMSGRNQGYCAHLYERPEIKACFNEPDCKNPFELCVQALREGIGEDRIFLACQGHNTGPEAAYANASRLGADIVHPNQPVKWSGVENQARCFLNQAFSHNIVMFADPDTLLVRDLPIEEARTSATIIALPGQLTFFGDKLNGLPDEKMKILQQTLPVTDVLPANLYPYFEMLPVWNLRIHNGKIDDYNVVAFFNWNESSATISATYDELGISAADYVGFEFWTKKSFAFASDGNFSVEVPAHGVRVVALHAAKNIPQWIGSDRHITINAQELIAYNWNASSETIETKVYLIGGFPLELYFRIPSNRRFIGLSCKNAKYSFKQDGELLCVTLQSKNNVDVELNLEIK